MRRLFAIVLLVACTLFAPSQQAAAQQTVTRITLEALAAAMKQNNWGAEVAVDQGTKYLRVTVSGSTNGFVDGFDCNAQGCSWFSIYAFFNKDPKYTAEFARKFQLNTVFIKGAITDDGRFLVAYDFAAEGGVTLQHLMVSVAIFEEGVNTFYKAYNDNK